MTPQKHEKVFENNRKDITVAMMKNYLQLLHKFSADKANVSSLVEIITFMNYSLKRQEQSFKDAILFIKDAFLMNGEEEALRSCVKAITFCASKIKGKLQDFSREQLKDLEEKLLEKLTSAIQDVKNGKDESPLIVNLKRLYELQLSKQFPFEDMYDELAYMLHNFRNLDEKVICFLLLNMHVDVVRSLRSIVDCETLPEASLSSLISKRGTLFKELLYFLNRVEVSGKYGSQLSLRIYAILAEEWCAFEKSKFDSTPLEKLGYCPEIDMVDSFWKHCQGILNNSDETDEEDENREYLKETNRDVAAIAACKLVTSDVVAKDYLGPEIISHLVMHGPSLTEIIKNFITCLRNTEADLSDIYLKSLKRGYQRYASELSCDGGESRVDKRLKMCRELAGQLSGMYIGAARNKHRLEILNVVKEGVEFAFIEAPKQLLFLEVAILPFATRLSVQDMMEIKLDVQERILQFNTDDDPSGWLPYFTFFKTLKKKCSKNEDLQGGDKEGAAVRRRGRPKKHPETERKRLFDGQSGSAEDGSISGGSDTEDEGDSVDEDAPLIEMLRSAKRRRALRGERAENRERSKGR